MDKQRLIAKVIEALEREAGLLAESANAAYEDATHGESRAENKYDTRGLLASYLAGAQSHRLAEVRKNLGMYRAFKLKGLDPDQGIAVGALVELRSGGETSYCFLGPGGGAGLRLELEGKEIQIISARSPLGDALRGLSEGESFSLKPQEKEYEITRVY